jgi:hypothetical protein
MIAEGTSLAHHVDQGDANMRHTLIALGCCIAVQLVACGGEQTPAERWQEALSYARHDIACEKDSDCCAVFSQCSATALIVSAADKARVEQLIPEVGDMGSCVACIPPAVQVRCESQRCVGSKLVTTTGGLADVQPFMGTHCGAMTVPVGWKTSGLTSSGFALPFSSLPYTIGCGS